MKGLRFYVLLGISLSSTFPRPVEVAIETMDHIERKAWERQLRGIKRADNCWETPFKMKMNLAPILLIWRNAQD